MNQQDSISFLVEITANVVNRVAATFSLPPNQLMKIMAVADNLTLVVVKDTEGCTEVIVAVPNVVDVTLPFNLTLNYHVNFAKSMATPYITTFIVITKPYKLHHLPL